MNADRAVWWGLLVLCAAGLWAAHASSRGGGGLGSSDDTRPGRTGEGSPTGEEIAGRYALGASRLAPMPLESLGLDRMEPAARLRMVPVVAEIAGPEKARAMLEGLRGMRDFDAFWRIYGEVAADPGRGLRAAERLVLGT